MHRFKDFADGEGPLKGTKSNIEDILGKEVIVVGYRIGVSKYAKTNSSECLTVQYSFPDDEHKLFIIFTGSSVLVKQFRKYEDKLPFIATFEKVGKYLTLS